MSSDFLGYLNRKKELERGAKAGPLVPEALKSSPGGKEKAPPPEPAGVRPSGGRSAEEVEYLNQRSSTVSVVL